MDAIIIKYYDYGPFAKMNGARIPLYAEVKARTTPHSGVYACLTPIDTAREAKEEIRRRGLVAVREDKNGIIYDTTDEYFLTKYRGKIKITDTI